MATSTIRFRAVMAGLRESRKVSKASDYLKGYIARFNKADPDSVRIDPKLNEYMMGRVVKTGSAIKVEITKDGGLIKVKLAPGQAPAQYMSQEKQVQKPAVAATTVQAKPSQAKTDAASKPAAAAPKAAEAKAAAKPAGQAEKKDEPAKPAAQGKPAKKKPEPQKESTDPAKPE